MIDVIHITSHLPSLLNMLMRDKRDFPRTLSTLIKHADSTWCTHLIGQKENCKGITWEKYVNKVVLIVDDEPANIELIKGLLPNNCKCKAAINGQIALKQLQKSKPDLVILDLVMPGMDGFQTLREIRNDPKLTALPVIIVSGETDSNQIESLKELGILAFVKKPIESQLLLSEIETIIGGAQDGQQ